MNGIIEEILEEDESDINDMNNLMCTAATTMKQTLNHPNKRNRNSRKKCLGNKNTQINKLD